MLRVISMVALISVCVCMFLFMVFVWVFLSFGTCPQVLNSNKYLNRDLFISTRKSSGNPGEA